MKNITRSLFFFLSSFVMAQNGGDTCATSVVVAPGDFTGTIITQDTASGEQGTTQPRDSAWFSYTPDADGTAGISACSLGTDTRLYVGTGDCGSLTTVASDDDGCAGTFSSVIDSFPVTAGITYLIEWDDRWNGSELPFDWTLTYIAPPACVVSDELAASDITDASTTLTWSEVAGATQGYKWVVMANGEDPADEANTPVAMGMTVTSELTAMATGLTENTVYDAYVRSNCDVEEFSEYSDVTEFATTCSAQVPYYQESFDGGIVPPECWTEASNGLPSEGPLDIGFGAWGADDYLNDEVSSEGMDNAARVNLFFNSKEEWLISPVFDLSGSTYELVYNVGAVIFNTQNSATLGSDDEVQVLISEDDGATWQLLLTYDAANTPSNFGQEEIIDLSVYNGTAIFAFWATEGTVNDIEDVDFFIDEFKVRSPLGCTVPDLSYNFSPDCDNTQFSVEVIVNDLGSSPIITIADNQGSDTQMTDSSGSTLTFGPYVSGTTLTLLTTGDNANCFVEQNLTFFCPPINDSCLDAMNLPLGEDFEDQAIIDTNISATDSGVGLPSCSVYNGGDVWFTTIVPTDAPLFIETRAVAGSDIDDAAMQIYIGNCDDLTEIQCDDDSGDGNFSLITIDENDFGGQIIYIRVWENNNNSFGDFQISAYSESSLGINDITIEGGIALFPNPAQNELNITNLSATASVIVINALGQRVMEVATDKLDVSALKSGMYFVTVQDGSASQTLRFIKK